MLARHPRVTMVEALTDIRSEEIHLREAGILPPPSSVLAVRPEASSVSSKSSTTPSFTSPARTSPVVSSTSSHLHFTYCDKDGHVESFCFRKKKDCVVVPHRLLRVLLRRVLEVLLKRGLEVQIHNA